MYSRLKIVKIDSQYCDYLRKYDDKVTYNAGTKELRPYIGILFTIENCEYFAPLSSPKPKHKTLKNTLDLMKIFEGKYGVVNFNNMIPVTPNNYIEFKLSEPTTDEAERKRNSLMSNQLRWLNSNKVEIYKKTKLLYKLYKEEKLPQNVRNRCCNFPLLEIKCNEYNQKQ